MMKEVEEGQNKSSGEQKLRILIADDTEFFRMILGDVLKAEGYEVLFATNGIEALELIEQEKSTLSLVVMDIIMPVCTGKEVLQQLKASGFQRSFPILVMTGFKQDPEEIKVLRSLGIDGFISKTEPPKFFIARIKQAL